MISSAGSRPSNRSEATENFSESSLLTAMGPTDVTQIEATEPVEVKVVEEPETLQLNDMHSTSTTKVVPRWMQFADAQTVAPEQTTGDGGVQSVAETEPEPEPELEPEPVMTAAPRPEPMAAPRPEPMAAPRPEPMAAPRPEAHASAYGGSRTGE